MCTAGMMTFTCGHKAAIESTFRQCEFRKIAGPNARCIPSMMSEDSSKSTSSAQVCLACS